MGGRGESRRQGSKGKGEGEKVKCQSLNVRWMEFSSKRFLLLDPLPLSCLTSLFFWKNLNYQEGVKVGKGMRQKGEGKGRRRSWKVKANRKVER